jgi:hypothetical protein
MSVKDNEITIMAMIAFWGGGSLSSEEFNFIKNYHLSNESNISFNLFTDSNDKDLSIKEYLLFIIEFIDDFKKSNNERRNSVEAQNLIIIEISTNSNEQYRELGHTAGHAA